MIAALDFCYFGDDACCLQAATRQFAGSVMPFSVVHWPLTGVAPCLA